VDSDLYRQKILTEIDELHTLSDASKAGRAPVELDQQSVGRLSRMDAMQQQSMDLAREERRRHRLAVLNAALRRLDEDEYGYCLACGEDVLPERLDIDPAVTLCVACQDRC
jgi:DnaK suppressor protein